MVKHTPGPWTVFNERWDEEKALFASVVADSVECAGCEIAALHGHPPYSERDGLANARLIAAAPDLLEAVTIGAEVNLPDFLDWLADRSVNVYGESPNVDFVHTCRDRAKKIRAAIAKAEGR